MRENTRVCKYGSCDFLLRKNGCSNSLGVAAVFCFADQLNIALSMRRGDPVRIRNNRPLLYLARAMSQRACHIDWVFML